MKKLLALLLALVMLFSLAACGAQDDDDDDNGKKGGGSAAGKGQQQEFEDFSIEAVEHYLKAYGIDLADLEPEWDWILPSDYSAYADDPSSGYGHAAVKYRLSEGELTDEQIDDYYAAVFAATAAASDDGYNIIGYEFVGEGEDALAETTLEDALSGWMQGWGFRHNGTLMVVYVSSSYDNEKDSELDRLFYYNGVGFDIGVGLQKSFDDTLGDMEDYFEENEDEIKDAINDYLN